MSFFLKLLLFTSTTLCFLPSTNSLGSSASLAATSSTVCGLSTSTFSPSIQCYHLHTQLLFHLLPFRSFSSLSAGSTTLCALRDGGTTFLCWDNINGNFPQINPPPKRIYHSTTAPLKPASLSLGRTHICAISSNTSSIKCWRFSDSKYIPHESHKFVSISSGYGFSCGIMENSSKVQCWGSDKISISIESELRNFNMSSIVAGGSHVCGIDTTGHVICKGNNKLGQLNVPFNSPGTYSLLSLGESHSCGIRRLNGTVVCWGGAGTYSEDARIERVSFEVIVAGVNFTCGLVTSNFSVVCWGPGWTSVDPVLPLSGMIPGPCVKTSVSCSCGVYVGSQRFCYGSGVICKNCESPFPGFVPSPPLLPTPPLLSPPPPASNSSRTSGSQGLSGILLALVILAPVGVAMALCSLVHCCWTIFRHNEMHNPVQPTITRGNSINGGNSNRGPLSGSPTLKHQSSGAIRRQRSGTSKQDGMAEEFSLVELAVATSNFSIENKLGAGGFGVVYRGKLPDGQEVAIKRGDTGIKTKRFEEKKSAFDSELALLSRIHHKHLVRLIGHCEENDEKLLVYEYMKNGTLHDHLHGEENVDKASSLVNSWKVRIKIALDDARGIDYLHNYAVPPIIHRDIKSSNILLDANWTARVSDFGLSLLDNPKLNPEYSLKPAGTLGYIAPDYFGLNVLTTKSDVYGFGVVLLEVLTGKKAIFNNGEDSTTSVSLVEFAVPILMAGEWEKVLDQRVGPAELNEAEAVKVVADTAMHCVNREGENRPPMNDIVVTLERALSLFGDSYGSTSSGAISPRD